MSWARFFDLHRLTIHLPSGIIPSFAGGRAVQRNGSRIRRRLKCLFLVRLFSFFGEDAYGSAQGRRAHDLPQITFWRRSAARSSRVFTALWTWQWSASIRGRPACWPAEFSTCSAIISVYSRWTWVCSARPCHGGRCGDLVCCDALALFHPPEHAAAPAPGASDAPAAGDRCHRVLDVFYRCGDGHPGHPLQPPDHALAIYGPVINISTFVQCCAYSVGQAAQPIISTNFGAHQGVRIRAVLRLALVSCAAFSIFWTALSLAQPNLYIRIFMRPTGQSSSWRRVSSGRMPCRSCCCR